MGAPKKNSEGEGKSMVLRFRAVDTPFGLTRKTWQKTAAAHGLSETEAIHRAMVIFASKTGATMKKKLPQEQLPVDLSGYQLRAFASFVKTTAPDWVANSSDGQGTNA